MALTRIAIFRTTSKVSRSIPLSLTKFISLRIPKSTRIRKLLVSGVYVGCASLFFSLFMQYSAAQEGSPPSRVVQQHENQTQEEIDEVEPPTIRLESTVVHILLFFSFSGVMFAVLMMYLRQKNQTIELDTTFEEPENQDVELIADPD